MAIGVTEYFLEYHFVPSIKVIAPELLLAKHCPFYSHANPSHATLSD